MTSREEKARELALWAHWEAKANPKRAREKREEALELGGGKQGELIEPEPKGSQCELFDNREEERK